MKQQFCEWLESYSKQDNTVLIKKEKYDNLIKEVLTVKKNKPKLPRHYWLLKHYDVLTVDNIDKLIYPIKNGEILYYVYAEELYEILHEAHSNVGHGGRDRMIKELNRKYKNVTQKQIRKFLDLCEVCLQKRKMPRKGVVVKPLLFKELNARGQVDLIDYQSQSDGEYRFVMVYQDHLTKFVVLKALTSKKAKEVAQNLIPIFTFMGAPSVLQSDNGREFVNEVITNLKELWPSLNIVHGAPRHSQSQGSVERANQDVENMITSWMATNKSPHWATALPFIQWMKNSAYHFGIKMAPYEALFGVPPKVGLSTSALPKEILQVLTTEEDLKKAIESCVEKDAADAEEMNAMENSNNESEVQEPQIVENTQSRNNDSPVLRIEESENDDHQILDALRPEEDKENAVLCGTCFNQLLDVKDPCHYCTSKENISKKRKIAFENLEKQAEKMKKESDKKFGEASVGTTVRVPVPEVDRGKGDHRSILGVVLESDNGFYKIGTRSGVLKSKMVRSQFDTCREKIISSDEVPDKEYAIRTIATSQSLGTGQGFFKCSCKQNCQTNRCKCFKNNVLCNSKCHNSSSCGNKG